MWFFNKTLVIILFSVILTFFFLSPGYTFAKKNELPVITIINPIRGKELGHERDNLSASLKAQFKAIKNINVKATWLWQYTALEDEAMVNFARENMKTQEFGLFLEIDRNHAQKADIQYRGQGPWYFSDGLFLVSYDIKERRKLIDTSFALFKKSFGFYPKTVGAWWIGADSIVYMQKKYGIVAAMRASDQFDLDVYSIWGSPWSIPYISSAENEAIPANSFEDSSKVVILQWAPRDPLNGYTDAMFSLQDLKIQGYDFSYTDFLSSIYLKKPLDNLNVGLENGGTFEQFDNYYKDKLTEAKKLEKEQKIEFLLVKDYAEKFLSKQRIFAGSDIKYFLSKDYKSDDQSLWYHSPKFRAGIHKVGNMIYLVDLRNYTDKINEDFSFLTNSQGYLRITTPAIIDSMRFPNQKILLAKSKEALRISEDGDDVTLFSGDKKIALFTKDFLKIFPDKDKPKVFDFSKKTSHLPTVKFDKKQLLLFSILPIFSFMPISSSLFSSKILPLFILLILFYSFVIRSSKKWHKPLFYSFSAAIIVFYIKVPYFPLDRSTFDTVGLFFVVIAFVFVAVSFIILKKIKSKKTFIASLISIPFVMLILAGVIYVSRTTIILAPFEADALEVIKEKNKDVIFISETDYNIKPIYKAVRPLLYENYRLAEKLTDTKWEVTARPENNLIILADYKDKLVVAPRYLGADFSNKEMEIHGFKKIFDNAQIAIFERR